jgi:class 3 adenylate cyclase
MKDMGVIAGEVHAPDACLLTTVLLTDVVDSTRRALELGDRAWLTLQTRHETMVRRTIRRFGGRCLSTTGDGIVAMFQTAAAGVRCATQVASASPPLGLEVRAALHCGATVRRGTRIGGLVFHVAARVLTLAQPSEVLVSASVRDEVVESDLRFADRGNRALRGLPGSWSIYAATADSAPSLVIR